MRIASRYVAAKGKRIVGAVYEPLVVRYWLPLGPRTRALLNTGGGQQSRQRFTTWTSGVHIRYFWMS